MKPAATLLLLAAACGTTPVVASQSSSGAPTASEITTTGSAPSETSTTGTTSDTELSTSSSTADDTSSGRSFITDPDGLPAAIECSIYAQDCPRGEKCNAWANDGGSAWNATKCVPVDPDPDGAGEPCTVTETGVSGLDSCDVGSMCWDVDARTGEGTCLPYCVGDPTALTCQDPDRYCHTGGAGVGVLSICFPQCSPLDVDTCPAGTGCYPFAIEDLFRCEVDDSGTGGGAFESCFGLGTCAPGLHCADAVNVGFCEDGDPRCCAPFCDLAESVCPLGTVCIPYFVEPAPIHDNLGYCGLESA